MLEQEEVRQLLSLTREEQKNTLIDLAVGNLKRLSRRMEEIVDDLPAGQVPIAYGIAVERLLDLLHGRKGVPVAHRTNQYNIMIGAAEAARLKETMEAVEGESRVVEES